MKRVPRSSLPWLLAVILATAFLTLGLSRRDPSGHAASHDGHSTVSAATPQVAPVTHKILYWVDPMVPGAMGTREDLKAAIVHGAVKLVRPKVMTVACAFFGLVPIMWSSGTGANVMKRIAAPMIGGLFRSFATELLVHPRVCLLWKWHTDVKNLEIGPDATAVAPVAMGG